MVHLEGKQSVLAALEARRRRIQIVLIKHDTPMSRVQDVLDAAATVNVPVRMVEGAELSSLSHGATHGGVLAICHPKPCMPGDELIDVLSNMRPAPLLVMLEGVDDARNLGFTIRSAEAMGVTALLIKRHLWDFDETEVARAASGAYERLPLVQFDDLELIKRIQKQQIRVYGCLAGVKRTIYDVNLAGPCLLAIGGEKRGLSGAMRELCDRFVTIPTLGGASSLSLSHAGAIVIAEAGRQRRAATLIPMEDTEPAV